MSSCKEERKKKRETTRNHRKKSKDKVTEDDGQTIRCTGYRKKSEDRQTERTRDRDRDIETKETKQIQTLMQNSKTEVPENSGLSI